ncbi:MAG TPA: ribose ABC transporter substrate-binding protein [Treponema sp.]|nr:MAG: ribose ABC transporter substrate-binding protein [Treponema sp. GWA1_62_8]OHE64765.1 MAG: ribose ABC transporter substrate-binding protein [Treponema sp. GWC1_61_84]OHE68008.1 MAG: ribose ABC transporter substrate-binding protein [Treponema sp. RIFOXYC1_FULL_61_9]HCM27608.1 ribose ABC transporter substrate-binding protein [Treponema sp.]
MKAIKVLMILFVMAAVSAGSAFAAGSAEKKFVVGFSQATMNHPHRVAMVEVNRKWAEANCPDVELIITDGQNNATKQVSDVEDLLARKIDLLIISPITEEALTSVVKRAMDTGVKVVTLDRRVNTPVTCHVGAENKPIGTFIAKFINEKLDGKGNIIEIQGTAGASATIDRHDSFTSEVSKYPGLKVAGTQYCDYMRENAMKYMEDMLQRFGPGQIQAVYAHNDEEALGAIKALEAADRLKEVLVCGVDGEELSIQAIKAGKQAMTVTYPYCAPEGIQTAYKILKGEKVASVIVLENKPIDMSNVDQWLGKGF